MKFLSYKTNEKTSFGVLATDHDYVIDLSSYTGQKSLLEFIISAANKSVVDIIEEARSQEELQIPITEIKLTSPIPQPRRNIICLGLNYLDHAKEANKHDEKDFKLSQVPIYFSKMASETIGHNESLSLDTELTKKLDYEVELAIVISKKASNIKADDVYDHIFGFTIMNDFTARDLQNKHQQWFKGKSLDTFTSLGPVISHISNFKEDPELYIRSYVNGELRQASNTNLLIHNIKDIVTDFSQGITLLPGDIIATGTPAGVAMAMDPAKFLVRGDSVVCEIEEIGMLSNKIK